MPQTRFSVIPAVYLILEKDDQILLLRRSNTDYMDGNYGLVAGHLDGGEAASAAMIREAKEEAGITLLPENLRLTHMMHRSARGNDAERLDLFFSASNWAGEVQNMEPEKCDDLSWFPSHSLPENIIPYVRQAIALSYQGILYSEVGWD